jgi:hypothetical protein
MNCNGDFTCNANMSVAEARAELKRVREGTSSPDWKPCGCAGCHWCELGAALKHHALIIALDGPATAREIPASAPSVPEADCG